MTTRVKETRETPSSNSELAAGPLLSVRDLGVHFGNGSWAVSGVDLEIGRGEIVGVAGESGSGKSMTALATIGLLPKAARVSGSIRFRGRELLDMSEEEWSAIRGAGITMVFQETVSALNPLVNVERQLTIAIRSNLVCSKDEARFHAEEALKAVKMHDIDRVLKSYPHELSGGMCQRVMIAMALGCGADVLLADEPTTALDATVQREVMEIIRSLVDQRGVSFMFISHDLGVLDEVSDRLVVMQAGRIVETGRTDQVLANPNHAYTRALLHSLPRIHSALKEFPESTLLSQVGTQADEMDALSRGPRLPFRRKRGTR